LVNCSIFISTLIFIYPISGVQRSRRSL